MGLNVFAWGWKVGNAIADLFTPQLITAKEEQEAIKQAEAARAKPYVPPKAYELVGDREYRIPLPPPPENSTKKITPPPTIQTTATEEDYIQPDQAGFPNWWQWLPGPWLYNQLRQKPTIYQPNYTKGIFKFGRLMCDNHNPVDEPLLMPEWDYMVAPADSQVALQASSDAFAWWMAKQGGASNLPPQVGDFYDQGALLWAVDIRAFNQGLALMYGIQAPADAFANMWIRSQNALAMTARGTTYTAIQPTPFSATNQRNYYEWQGEVDSAVGGAGLALSLSRLMKGEREDNPRIVLENSAMGARGLARVLAVDAFPFNVPVSLLLEPEDIEGKDDSEIYESIESIPQLLIWLTRALDELIGKFPVTMEIAESDLLDMNDEYAAWKSQDPPVSDLPFYLRNDKMVSYREEDGQIIKTVKVPNLAEAMAEVLGLSMAERTQNDLGIELLTRCMTEIGSTKNLTVNANGWIEAVADYLGFQAQDQIQEVEFTYNPVLEMKEGEPISWQEFLKPTAVKTGIPQFSDKQTFEGKFELIKEIHAIVKAALTEGIGKTDAQMLGRIKSFAMEMGINPKRTDQNNDGTPDQTPEKDDFDRFLEDVETGFIGQGAWTGESLPEPYGREFSKRPRIRRLGNTSNDSQ